MTESFSKSLDSFFSHLNFIFKKINSENKKIFEKLEYKSKEYNNVKADVEILRY